MKRAGKISIGVIVAIIIIVGIALYLAWSNLDSLVAGAIEHYGSRATGTAVSVGKVDVSLTKGTAELHNLTIANPKGYRSSDALTLKDIRIGLDISSLTTNTIVMQKGVVDGMDVNAEFKGRDNNLSQILDNVKQYVGPSKPRKQPAGQKKFIVKNFRFTHGRATVMLDAADKQRTIDIPAISIHDIGVKSNGVNAGELAKQLLRPVIQRIEKQARDAAKHKAEKALHKKGKELKKKARDKLKNKLKHLGDS